MFAPPFWGARKFRASLNGSTPAKPESNGQIAQSETRVSGEMEQGGEVESFTTSIGSAFRVEKLPHDDPEESLPQGSPVVEKLPQPEPAEILPQVCGDDRCGL